MSDPLLFGLSLFGSLFLFGLFLRHGVAPAVVGYNLVPSERVLGGEVPYRDFLYNYTPGTLWLNALLFKLLGTSLSTARIGVLVSKAASAALLFLIGRRYLGRALSLLAVAMMVAWVGYGDILKVFPTQYGMFFLLASCLALLRAQESEGTEARRWLLLAGIMAGGVFIFKHNVGLFALLALVAAACLTGKLAGGWKSSLMRAGLAALGFVAIGGGACAFLAARHALVPMVAHFAHHASVYAEAKGIALPHPRLLLPFAVTAAVLSAAGIALARIAPRGVAVYVAIALVLLLAVVVRGDASGGGAMFRSMVANVYYLPVYAACAGAICAALLYRRGKKAESGRVITLTLFALAAFLEIFPRSDPDHLIRVIPPSLLLMCVTLSVVKLEKNGRSDQGGAPGATDSAGSAKLTGRGLGDSIIVVAVCLLVIALGIRVTWAPQFAHGLEFKASAPLLFDRGRGVSDTPQEAGRLNGLVNFIQNNTIPGDPILAVSRKMTSLYFFAARPNITRLLWPDSAGILPAERDPIYQTIGDRRFKLIVVGGDQGGAEAPDGETDPDEENRTIQLVRENYHVEVIINGVSVYAPNP